MQNKRMVAQVSMDSPVGMLSLIAQNEHLVGIYFECEGTKHVERKQAQKKLADEQRSERLRSNVDDEILQLAKLQLGEYFTGKRMDFSIPLHSTGTLFQEQVWQGLKAIPYGVTCSYLDLAKAIGNPGAIRAVGTANGRNPLSIIVPCHRVIATGGGLGGYGGGLKNKTWLLNLERRTLGLQYSSGQDSDGQSFALQGLE